MTTKAELDAIRERDKAWEPRAGVTNANQAATDRRVLLNLFDQALAAAATWKGKYEDTLCEECFGAGSFPTGYDDRTVKCKRCDGTGKEP
jgi:hypothetical protein